MVIEPSGIFEHRSHNHLVSLDILERASSGGLGWHCHPRCRTRPAVQI